MIYKTFQKITFKSKKVDYKNYYNKIGIEKK